QKLFQFGKDMVIRLQVRGRYLRASNKRLEAQVTVESNAGSFTITIRADLPVKPYPDGVLAGARSPRQLAEKAKARAKEAVSHFENGAVAAWYQSNGWTYPVQGPAAGGLSAVQQFFEALGLTPPPRVDIQPKALVLRGKPGEQVQG